MSSLPAHLASLLHDQSQPPSPRMQHEPGQPGHSAQSMAKLPLNLSVQAQLNLLEAATPRNGADLPNAKAVLQQHKHSIRNGVAAAANSPALAKLHTAYNLFNDVVMLTSIAVLCSLFNLIGRLVDDHSMVLWSQPLPCLAFIGFARAWTLRSSAGMRGNAYTNAVTVGLFFSAVGDTLLALNPSDLPQSVLEYLQNVCESLPGNASVTKLLFDAGLVAFFIVHVCYIIAFTFCLPVSSSAKSVPLRLMRGLPFALFGIAWHYALSKSHVLQASSDMYLFVMLHIIIELIACWRAAARVGLRNENPMMQTAAFLGILAFTACDFFIGFRMFVYTKVVVLTKVNMTIYWIGQVLIALSCNQRLDLEKLLRLCAVSGTPDGDANVIPVSPLSAIEQRRKDE